MLDYCEYVIGTLDDLKAIVKSVYDWNCVVVASDSSDPMRTFYLGNHLIPRPLTFSNSKLNNNPSGLGDNNVYYWNDWN